MKAELKWEPRAYGLGHWGQCWEYCPAGPTGFTLRLEPGADGSFAVAVINDHCLYRSNKRFSLDEAKQEAVRAGIKVARQEARLHTQIAEHLAKHRERALLAGEGTGTGK